MSFTWTPITSDPYFWLGAVIFFVGGYLFRGMIPDKVGMMFGDNLVLLALGEKGESYAVPLHSEVAELAGRNVSFGYIYAHLDRLEAKGLVTSRKGEATAIRGWRHKQYYRLTDKGEAIVKLMHEAERIVPN